jgi:hypothetical protein
MSSRPTRQQGGTREDAATGMEANVASVIPGADVPTQIRRRRTASLRLPPMVDGRRDPLDPDTRFRCVECERDVRLKPYIRLTAQTVLCKPCFKASGGVSW